MTIRVEDLTRRPVEGGASRRLVCVHGVRVADEVLPVGLNFSSFLNVL